MIFFINSALKKVDGCEKRRIFATKRTTNALSSPERAHNGGPDKRLSNIDYIGQGSIMEEGCVVTELRKRWFVI